MSMTTEVHTDGPGVIVVRRASGPADVARLRQITDRLGSIGHPGVVQVRSAEGTDDEWELRLDYAGRPVEVLGALSAEQVAGVAAGVAATLADLHGAGVVHGRVDPSHVLVGPEGRPILCGLGGAQDPAARPEDDVAAVGELILSLLGSSGNGTDLEPIPDRRWSDWRGLGTRWDGWTRRALLLLADQACADPATRRPTARRLAAAIHEAVPTATLPDVAEQPAGAQGGAQASEDPFAALRPLPDPVTQRPRWLGLAVSAAAVIVLALGSIAAVQRARSASATTPSTEVAPVAPSPTTAPPTTAPPTTGTSEDQSSPGVPVIGFGGREYRIGQPGDRAVVGDWDGDGEPTPAVLRPSTGEVFVFSSWTIDQPITVQALTSVDGAVDIYSEPADGKDQLVVRRFDGSRTTIAVTT